MNESRMKGFFFRQAWQNLVQNLWINAFTLGTITLSFLILGLFLIVALNARGLLEEWGSRIRVTAYLADPVTAEGGNRLKDQILGMEEAQAVIFRSKEEALKSLEEKLQGRAGLLKGLPRNPLPASLEIQLKPAFRDKTGVERLAKKLKAYPEISDLQFGAEWIERFSAFVIVLQALGAGASGLLLLTTILIVANTIRWNIFARREEIEIMRSVGATGIFIRAPFYMEGFFQGLIGACLALALLFGLFQLFLVQMYDPLKILLGNFPLQFLSWEQGVGLALGGITLGLLGTQVSVGRHLKV
jgi:cell division transport system permease protein